MPVINEEVTVRCIESMGWYRDVYLVDNSPDQFAVRRWGDNIFEGRIFPHPENLGVSASWNIGIELARDHRREFLIIMSAGVEFEKGGWQQFLAACHTQADRWGLDNQWGWHCLCLRMSMVEEVGLFDSENFPSYFEDNDYIWRMKCKTGFFANGEGMRKYHLNATMPYGYAHAIKKSGVKPNWTQLQNRYIEKWGSVPGDEKWSEPFGV